jgi:hypothetical protein
MAELKRIGASLAKVKAAAAGGATSAAAARPLRVDGEAGRRVVAHALAPNASLKLPAPLGGAQQHQHQRQRHAEGASFAAAAAAAAEWLAAPGIGSVPAAAAAETAAGKRKGGDKAPGSGGDASGCSGAGEEGKKAKKKMKRHATGAGDFM